MFATTIRETLTVLGLDHNEFAVYPSPSAFAPRRIQVDAVLWGHDLDM
jgi:hypothetical protein